MDIHELRDAFATSLPLPEHLEPHLRDALLQTLRNAGNLVRSKIVLQMADAYDVPEPAARKLAMAIEYFHTASLLFDDLPCMDNAMERRGALCLHVQYGVAGAILTALALINRAYALAWQAVQQSDAVHPAKAILYIEKHLGVGGLLNGQSLDLNYSSLPHDLPTTERVAYGKTVALIRLTVVLPALLGGPDVVELQLLDRIARAWGLSYQIVDDLKDLLQSPEETGKTAARDISLGRPNVGLAIGIPAAVERLQRLMSIGEKSLNRLLMRRPGAVFLRQLRGSIEHEMQSVMDSACGAGARL